MLRAGRGAGFYYFHKKTEYINFSQNTCGRESVPEGRAQMNESFRQPGIHAGEADGKHMWNRSPFSRWCLLRHAFSAEQSSAGFGLKVVNILLAFCFLLAMLQVLAAVFF